MKSKKPWTWVQKFNLQFMMKLQLLTISLRFYVEIFKLFNSTIFFKFDFAVLPVPFKVRILHCLFFKI